MTDQATDARGIELVLEHLKRVRAFDFTGYKRATLTRRIEKRMQQLGIEDHVDYVDHLEVHPEEFEPLFNTILINVTNFFRDPEMWKELREQVIPSLVSKRRDEDIRVWSAGCASGQEAYSAVIAIAEELGVTATRDRLKVYATDIDADALDQARQAHYSTRELQDIPVELVAKSFEATPRGAGFGSDLRRTVIFGRHDLLQDAPISRVDLLLCRNTLMYLNTDVQAQLIDRLHFSLVDGGVLVLGKVETLLGQRDFFQPIDAKQRIYRKLPRASLRSRLLAINPGLVDGTAADGGGRQLEEVAFEHAAEASILLDGTGAVYAVNSRARQRFGLTREVVGRPFQDLSLSYRPVELRSSIDQSRHEGRAVHLESIEGHTLSGELTYVDISIAPLSSDGSDLGTLISFSDVTHHRRVQE